MAVSVFNPNEHLMKLGYGQKAQDYLPVQWRLVWYREQCPEGTIETEMIHLDLDRETEEEVAVWNNEKRRSEKIVKRAKGFVIFRATVKDGKGGSATATKSEKAASFPDYIEKAETGAIGRALAELGYGTQFTGDELSEGHRIVDSPVDVQNGDSTTRQQNSTTINQHASKSRQDANLTGQKSPAPITQPATIVSAVDSAASDAGHSESLQPSDIEDVKKIWIKAYNVPEKRIEAWWIAYLKNKLTISQPDLKPYHLGVIKLDCEQHEAEQQSKAS